MEKVVDSMHWNRVELKVMNLYTVIMSVMSEDPRTYDEYVRRFIELATHIGFTPGFVFHGMNRLESKRYRFHPIWFQDGPENDIVGLVWAKMCERFYDEDKDVLLPVMSSLDFTSFLEVMGWTTERSRKLAECYRPTSSEQYLIIAIHEIERSKREMWNTARQNYLAKHPEARRYSFDNYDASYNPIPTLDTFRRNHSLLFQWYMMGPVELDPYEANIKRLFRSR